MSERERIVIIGGGLAGLSAAVACLDAGVHVHLFEGRSRLGGATWSQRRHGLTIDNGQHVFLRCCTAYRSFLDRLGVRERTMLQARLAIPVVAPNRPLVWLRRDPLPSPLHLARSLLGFTHLPFAERIRAGRTTRELATLDPTDPAVDAQGFGTWLAARGASPAAIDIFWDLLIRPTLNIAARDASLALAAKVFQTGLLIAADGADVGYPIGSLDSVHAEPAAALLRSGGATLSLRARVDRIDAAAAGGVSVWVDGQRRDADAVIVATPHDAAADLLPTAAGVDPSALRALSHSPIVNLHVVFDRRVTALPFFAGVRSRVQWAFDRTVASGLDHGQYLAISLSAADEYIGLSEAALQTLFIPELAALLPGSRNARVERFFVTHEPQATFRQGPATLRHRPPTQTRLPGLFLAGAWTNTGWPATMESAVRSGLAAAREALIFIRNTKLTAETQRRSESRYSRPLCVSATLR